jgi:hypothetical protein
MALSNTSRLQLSFSTAYIITNETVDFSSATKEDLVHIPYDSGDDPQIKFEFDSIESNSNSFGNQLADHSNERLRAVVSFPKISIEEVSTVDKQKNTAFHKLMEVCHIEITVLDNDNDGNEDEIKYTNTSINTQSYGQLFMIQDDEVHVLENIKGKFSIKNSFSGNEFPYLEVELYGNYKVYDSTDTTGLLSDTSPSDLRTNKFIADTVGTRVSEIENITLTPSTGSVFTPTLNSVEISDGRDISFDFTSTNSNFSGVEAITTKSSFTVKLDGKLHSDSAGSVNWKRPEFNNLNTKYEIEMKLGENMTFTAPNGVIDPNAKFETGNEDGYKTLSATYLARKDTGISANIKIIFTGQ